MAGENLPAPNEPINEPSDDKTDEEFMQEVGRLVNSAVTSHLKRELPRMTAQFSDTLKPIQEQLTALAAAARSAPAAVENKTTVDPELQAMRAQHEELKNRFEAERKAREAAETRQRNEATRTTLLAAIDPLVRPESKQMLADWLFQKSIEFGDDGTPLFKLRKSPGAGMPEEDVQLPLEAGVREFLKSKEAEWLIPQRSATPGKPGGKSPLSPAAQRSAMPQYDRPAATDEEKVRRAMEREEIQNALNAQR